MCALLEPLNRQVIEQRIYGDIEQKGLALSPLRLITWAAACPGRTAAPLYSWATNERVPNVTVIPDCPEKFTRWQIPCLCSLTRQDESGEEQRRRKCRVARNIKKKKNTILYRGWGVQEIKNLKLWFCFWYKHYVCGLRLLDPTAYPYSFIFFPLYSNPLQMQKQFPHIQII